MKRFFLLSFLFAAILIGGVFVFSFTEEAGAILAGGEPDVCYIQASCTHTTSTSQVCPGTTTIVGSGTQCPGTPGDFTQLGICTDTPNDGCPATSVNGQCGSTINSCTSGAFIDTADTSSTNNWQCQGTGGGTTASCSTPKAVNGICGSTLNSCTAGTFQDTSDTSTNYLWSCLGSGGGTTASCSQPKSVQVCTPGATQSCSISGCTIPAGGIQQCKDDGSGWSGCACKAACTANFTPSSINAGQSATFNATVSGWAFTQPVWSCSGGATAGGSVTSSVSKTFTNVLSPISCQVGVAGYYGSTASCPATVNVNSVPKYRCSGGSPNTCIQDNVNGTLPAGCNNSCVQPAQCTLDICPSSDSVQVGGTKSFGLCFDQDGPGGQQFGVQDVRASGSWQSLQPSIATSLGGGSFRGASVGTAPISATYSSCPGKTATGQLIVTSAPNNPPVINSCDINPKNGAAPLTTNYTSSASDLDGDSITYYWNFGFGEEVRSASGSFTYAAPGTYSVTLKVKDSKGAWSNNGVPVSCGIVNVGTAPPQNQLPIGFHDNNDNASCTVNGWTTDPNDRNIDLTVKIYSDGTFVKSAVANKSRSDLQSAGVCSNGTCAFSENLSGLITQGATHQIRVRALDAQTQEEVDLANTPLPITCTAAPVNGECGSAQGIQSATAPSTNLCRTGNPTSVSDGGTIWIWGCLGSNGGSPASCSAPKTITPQNITVSGRVFNQTSGAGIPNVTLDTCWFGTKTTNANGDFSFTATKGNGFCLRATSGVPSGFTGPSLNPDYRGGSSATTYEHQVAGKACGQGESCYTEADALDRASDSGYDFKYTPPIGCPSGQTTPSCQNNICTSACGTASCSGVGTACGSSSAICDNQWHSISPAAHGQSIVGIYAPSSINTQATQSNTTDAIATVARGDDQNFYYNWYRFGSQTWTGWTRVPNYSSPQAPGTFTGAALDVIAFGFDGLNHHIINWSDGWRDEHTDSSPHVPYGTPTQTTDGQGKPWNFQAADTLQYKCGTAPVCQPGQTKPYSNCQNGACVSVDECGISTCSNSSQCVAGPNPPTVVLTANNSAGPSITVPYNTPVTLSWTSTNANYCTASGDWSGSKNAGNDTEFVGNLTSTKTYTLTCTQSTTGLSASNIITVNVGEIPVADIKANGSNGPINIPYNTAANISWTSANISSCSVSPTGWTGLSNSGISTGNLTASQTYTLTCLNSAGASAQDSVTINISIPAITVSCTVSPADAKTGESVTWTAFASGGTKSYTYLWHGDPPLEGKTNNPAIVQYTTDGDKNGWVTVNSPGVSSKDSPACVNTITGKSGIKVTKPPPHFQEISPE